MQVEVEVEAPTSPAVAAAELPMEVSPQRATQPPGNPKDKISLQLRGLGKKIKLGVDFKLSKVVSKIVAKQVRIKLQICTVEWLVGL